MLPAWSASTVQVPSATSVTDVPDTVQTDGVTDENVTVSPDEAVADTALRVLAPLGLIFDENSPWLNVSACTGSPGCAHSAADVRADATQSLAVDSAVHRHFVGCDRACGSPRAGEVLVATGHGYRLLQGRPMATASAAKPGAAGRQSNST